MSVSSSEPVGYIGTPEAAGILGVHQETVRNYVKDGKLEGMHEYDPETKRDRYWVLREAVEELAQNRAKEESVESADLVTRRVNEVLSEIARQEHTLSQQIQMLQTDLFKRLEKISGNQDEIITELKRSADILESTAQRSRDFQNQMLDLKDKMLEMLEEEREHLREQRNNLGHEERRGRGFWHRLFGMR